MCMAVNVETEITENVDTASGTLQKIGCFCLNTMAKYFYYCDVFYPPPFRYVLCLLLSQPVLLFLLCNSFFSLHFELRLGYYALSS